MKQSAVEYFVEQLEAIGFSTNNIIEFENEVQIAKEMEEEQQGYSKEEVLELIQFLAEREDFEGHHPMSIFIAQDFLNEFKNK
jgi:hypothetical protein